MTAADQTLSVRFEADVTELRAALVDVSKRVKQYEKDAEGAADRSARAHRGAASAIVTALGRIAATIVSVQTAMRLAQNTNAVHDNAQAVGIAAQRYQELLFAAKEAGLTQEQFTVALTRFTTQVGEARTKTGGLYTFLRDSLPVLKDQLLATRSNGEAFDVVAQGVARLTTNEQRALLIKKAFGEEAWRLQNALSGGVAGLEDAAARARQFGQILDDDTIKQTKRLSEEITKAKDSILALGQTMIGVAAGGINQFTDWLRSAAGEAGKLADNVNRISRSGGAHGLLGGGSGRGGLAGLPTARDVQNFIDRQGDLPDWELEVRPDTRARDALQNLETQLAQVRGQQYAVIEAEKRQSIDRLSKLARDGAMGELEIQDGLILALQITEEKKRELRRGTNRMLGDLHYSALEASGEYYSAIRLQYEQDVEDLRLQLERKLITQAQFEKARDNLSAVTAERLRQRMRADAENVASQLSEYRSAVEGNVEAFTRGQVAARQFFQSLITDISNAITKMLILKPLMDGLFGTGKGVDGKSIGGGGIVGGLIGSLTGKPLAPQRAEGGSVMAGVPYLINERAGRRPEVFVPSVPGNMVPGERAGGMGGGAAGNVTNNYVDARYSDTGVEDRIFARLAQLEAKRPSPAAQTLSYQRRFPTRR